MCRRGRVGRVPGQAPRVASRGHAGAPLELYAIGWSCKLGSHTWSCENSPVCACVPQCAIVSVCFSVGACNNVGMNRKHITRFADAVARSGKVRTRKGSSDTRHDRRRVPGRWSAPPPRPERPHRQSSRRRTAGLEDGPVERTTLRSAMPGQPAGPARAIACTHFPDMHVSSP